MYLIRTAFWLSIVILLLPTGRSETEQPEVSKMSLNEAVSAASSTANDVAGFCDRNPGVCETGKQALKAFGEKAKYGANLAYEWATTPSEDKPSANKQADASTVMPGKGDRVGKSDQLPKAKKKNSSGTRSQNTLTRDDLEPRWKGPGNPAA